MCALEEVVENRWFSGEVFRRVGNRCLTSFRLDQFPSVVYYFQSKRFFKVRDLSGT